MLDLKYKGATIIMKIEVDVLELEISIIDLITLLLMKYEYRERKIYTNILLKIFLSLFSLICL